MTIPESPVAETEDKNEGPYVFVTGSSGHLGSAFVKALPSWGFKVVSLDLIPSPETDYVSPIDNERLVKRILEDYNVKHIIHTATLHKPHVGTHTKKKFIDTNIAGTLSLLESASKYKIESFVFFSTTSTFGTAMSPSPGNPAIWIDEKLVPIPKNIYGITKLAAEDMCQIMHKETRMPIVILRTSRFFTEEDDDDDRRNSIGNENLKVLEMAYRRIDIEDVVYAGICAMRKAMQIGFSKYIVSAPPPFPNTPEVLKALDEDPGAVLAKYVPGVDEVWSKKNWKHLERIDRVYDSSKAVRELGWTPKFTFNRTIDMLLRDQEWRSELVEQVGQRGYHAVPTGVYTKLESLNLQNGSTSSSDPETEDSQP